MTVDFFNDFTESDVRFTVDVDPETFIPVVTIEATSCRVSLRLTVDQAREFSEFLSGIPRVEKRLRRDADDLRESAAASAETWKGLFSDSSKEGPRD